MPKGRVGPKESHSHSEGRTSISLVWPPHITDGSVLDKASGRQELGIRAAQKGYMGPKHKACKSQRLKQEPSQDRKVIANMSTRRG